MKVLRKFKRFVAEHTGVAWVNSYVTGRFQRNAVFIWIPKNAGSSLFRIIGAARHLNIHAVKYRFAATGVHTFGHMDYAKLVEHGYVSQTFDINAFKFAFCRNPYDRAVSLFCYLSGTPQLSAELSFLDFCRQLKEYGCEPIGFYNSTGLSQCNPQTTWLENIDLDFLGRFENFTDDTRTILNALNRPVPNELLHRNRSQRAGYKEYYCTESRSIIKTLYHDDFERFGYSTTLC